MTGNAWVDGCCALLHAHQVKRGVEVGVWRAGLSERLLFIVEVDDLILVDQWRVCQFLDGNGKIIIRGPGATPQEMEAACEHVKLWMHTMVPPTKRVTLLEMPSTEAAWHVKDHSQDFVIIDASHEYVHVAEDLEAWERKVKRGGIFLGDDFTEQFPGVEKAVRERYGKRVHVMSPIWYVNR